MKIVEQGAKMGWDPQTTDAALRSQAGFNGGLADYTNALADGFKQLDKA